jgi:hypothetical protein
MNPIEGSVGRFEQLLTKLKRWPPRNITLLALDPGETTGYCYMNLTLHSVAFNAGQLETDSIDAAVGAIDPFFRGGDGLHLDVVVCEDYRVYSWKSDQHKWASLHTAQLIGCIRTLCRVHNMEQPVMQMAIQAKEFCTDDKLRLWGMYQPGKQHARDAIRHACSFLLFDKDYPKFFT